MAPLDEGVLQAWLSQSGEGAPLLLLPHPLRSAAPAPVSAVEGGLAQQPSRAPGWDRQERARGDYRAGRRLAQTAPLASGAAPSRVHAPGSLLHPWLRAPGAPHP